MTYWMFVLGGLFSVTALADEKPYQFRERLECVHELDCRDASLQPTADEWALADGFVIALPKDASPFVRRVARDFEEYLAVSMGVSARVTCDGLHIGAENVLSAGLVGDFMPSDRASLKDRSSRLDVGDGTAALQASDERALAQAFYHLEDLMNLRQAPFLKKGTDVRRAVFEVRMAHSGYGNDMFPEPHLAQMAHAGFTAILVFLDDIDKTKMQDYQDLQALIRRAKTYGLDTYLYSYITAFNHPDEGPAPFDASYGRIAGHYPEAKGIILVGESCQFPSKDPRVQPRTWKMGKIPGDLRPLAGWFPCKDYPDWLRAVKRAIHAKAPEMELVFWTYNWGWAPEADRLALIDALPKDVTMMATFEMFEMLTHRNGLTCPVADYTLTFAGPGKYFVSEARRAHERGLTLATQAMAGGPTWDFGTVPYQPCPHQWLNRWCALVKANADWGLSRVMENHHNGWWPSFVNELEKEAFTEGGIPFEEHIRRIAARDYGAANAEKAVAVWKAWSDRARDYVPTDINQYGPFRIGPAYPYTFGRPVVKPEEFPIARYACNGIGICRLDYLNTSFVTQNIKEQNDPAYTAKEIELLEPMAAAYAEGERVFAAMAGEKAARMANFAGYLAACVRTAINVKRGAIAFQNKDEVGVLAAARDEYRNATDAVKYVARDSRLGWEPTMEYAGGVEQIRWKLKRMERDYGKDLKK